MPALLGRGSRRPPSPSAAARLRPCALVNFRRSCSGGLRQELQLREQGDLVVVDLAADDPTVAVEMPQLADRQRPLLAGGREGSEWAVVRTPAGEAGYHHLAGVRVPGVGDLAVRGGLDPPLQEVVLELLRCPERDSPGVVDPADALGVLLYRRVEVPAVEGLV